MQWSIMNDGTLIKLIAAMRDGVIKAPWNYA